MHNGPRPFCVAVVAPRGGGVASEGGRDRASEREKGREREKREKIRETGEREREDKEGAVQSHALTAAVTVPWYGNPISSKGLMKY